MDVGALAPWVAKPTPAIMLNVQNSRAVVFHDEELPVPTTCVLKF